MLIAQNEAEELPTVSVNPYFSFGPVTKAVSEMKQHLNEFSNDELVKVAKSGEWGASIEKTLWDHCEYVTYIFAVLTRSFCIFAVNKMTFCQLDESKKKRTLKSESAIQEK